MTETASDTDKGQGDTTVMGKAWWDWVLDEPFRLFFASGILFSILGVLLWPMFYQGWLSYHPGLSHAHLMIESFAGAFVFGFMGTAGPRMVEAPPLRHAELLALFGLHVAGGICHVAGNTLWGDRLFVLTLGGFVAMMGYRYLFQRRDVPPVPFLLVAAGFLCGLVGALIFSVPVWWDSIQVYKLGTVLLDQGFLLGPLMGVGILLFPRMAGNAYHWPEPGPDTRRRLFFLSFIAAIFLLSFPVEIWGHAGAGLALRALAFVLAMTRVKWRSLERGGAGTLGNALRYLCMPLCVVGLLSPALLPAHPVALTHFLYVTGFGLACLIVGSRVLFGHSGHVERFHDRSWTARIVALLAFSTALTRVSADFIPHEMIPHLQYASLSWAVLALLWLVWHIRRFFTVEAE